MPVDGVPQQQKLPTPERWQNDNDQGKTWEFKDRAREASCPPLRIKRMVKFEGSNKILRGANYVCSENIDALLNHFPVNYLKFMCQ